MALHFYHLTSAASFYGFLLLWTDVLQITDFGMATVFRYQGQERELSRMCGTKPYTAPEVLKGAPYRAEPADLWSCGIILVTLLAGGRQAYVNSGHYSADVNLIPTVFTTDLDFFDL